MPGIAGERKPEVPWDSDREYKHRGQWGSCCSVLAEHKIATHVMCQSQER